MSGIAIDRARLQRVRDSARVAGRVAVAVVKSAGHFLGASAFITGSGFTAYHFLSVARQPDAVLLNQAIERARAAAAVHPSALAERDTALLVLALAIFFVGAGIWCLVDWWKALPSIRRAAE